MTFKSRKGRSQSWNLRQHWMPGFPSASFYVHSFWHNTDVRPSNRPDKQKCYS